MTAGSLPAVRRARWPTAKCCASGARAAYDDRPLGIGYSATISAPHMHAAALEFLAPSIAEKSSVLDGLRALSVAAFAALGKRSTVEYVPQLAKMADENLRAHDASLPRAPRRHRRRRLAGCPSAPFDAIHGRGGEQPGRRSSRSSRPAE